VPNGPNISSPSTVRNQDLEADAPREGGGAPGGTRILSISDDPGLGESRQLVLESAGYVATTVESHSPLGVAFVRTFDAAIVCQSLNPDCAVRLAERLHRYHPGIRVLRIRLYASDHHIGYDGTCDTLAGPEKLLESIEEMLMGERRGNSLVRPAV
jgi:hypothetical protein